MIPNDLSFRTALESDIDELLLVEESWPVGERANKMQLLSRMRKYSKGFWVEESRAAGRFIGFITSFPCIYLPGKPCQFSSWDEVTCNGCFPDAFDPTFNALYVASSVVDREYHGGERYAAMVRSFFLYIKHSLGIRWVVTGAVMPGYDAYCKKHGEISAVDYALKENNGRPIDPFLRKLKGLGLSIPGADYIRENYYADAPSRHYAAVLVADLDSLKPE